jgi:hypothetical protein
MSLCASSGDLWAVWALSQLTEIAPFRLTRPFDLAYTRFTASFGEFLAMGRRCFSADADGSSLIIISRR